MELTYLWNFFVEEKKRKCVRAPHINMFMCVVYAQMNHVDIQLRLFVQVKCWTNQCRRCYCHRLYPHFMEMAIQCVWMACYKIKSEKYLAKQNWPEFRSNSLVFFECYTISKSCMHRKMFTFWNDSNWSSSEADFHSALAKYDLMDFHVVNETCRRCKWKRKKTHP